MRRLQRGLRRAGYAPGPVDGRYGPLTAAAVARFQANHGLPVDGVVSLATRRAMQAPVVLSVGVGEMGADGSRVVARVQLRLRRLGFDPGPVDGRFGPRTERAVLAFQRRRHLSVSGVVGVRTERALYMVGRSQHHHPVASAPVKQTHTPSPAPRVSTPVSHAKPHSARVVSGTPSLPGIWILVGLGALGLVVVLLSYRRSRRRRSGTSDTPAAAGGDPTAETGGQG